MSITISELGLASKVESVDRMCEAREIAGLPPLQDPLPDYSLPASSFHLEDAFLDDIDVTRKASFYRGALAVLKLLSTPETMPHEDMIKLARLLTHESRHGLIEAKRDPGY